MRPIVYDDWQRLPGRRIRHLPSQCVFRHWVPYQPTFEMQAELVENPRGYEDGEDMRELRQMAARYAMLFCGDFLPLSGDGRY